jgi:hypothetical protein
VLGNEEFSIIETMLFAWRLSLAEVSLPDQVLKVYKYDRIFFNFSGIIELNPLNTALNPYSHEPKTNYKGIIEKISCCRSTINLLEL